jgi:L-ascorbate metabolism protein UlaG (beta-lactamase superfamily)
MELRRLGWSGFELTARGASLVIDTVTGDHPFFEGMAPVPPERTALAALVTHLHFDHTDVPAIEAAVGPAGRLLRPPPFDGTEDEAVFTRDQERALAGSSLDITVVAPWERHELGPFTVTAVPALDGLGDPQVGYVVEAGGVRFLHAGDTMFHSAWWLIAGRLGPFDVAMLPVNGAVVDAPHLQPPSRLPAAMDPAQAAQAAAILRAGRIVPQHYGAHIPGIYLESDDPVARLSELADRPVAALRPGETLGA